MTRPLEALTTATLALALDAASRRQEAFAANIANAGTPGFTPLQVEFESQLADARASLRSRGSVEPRDLEGVQPQVAPALDEPLRLDGQVAEMARNAVHYQALAQGLNRHLALLAAAAGDGRR